MDALPICTQCGFTWGEYRSRGLLGCPHCYASFGEALQGDLIWIHRALAQPDADAAPDRITGDGRSDGSDRPAGPEEAARWRERLADAVRREDYSEAARLQRLLLGGPPERSPDRGLG